jgi:hypothetical protein
MDYSLFQYELTTFCLLNNFGLTFALSDMNITTLACFWAPFSWKFFPYFHFKPMSVLASEVHFLQAKMVESCSLTQSTSLCLLKGI